MSQAIIFNAVAIFFIAVIIGFFAQTERIAVFLAALWVAFAASLFGWMIFVAVHFIAKYW